MKPVVYFDFEDIGDGKVSVDKKRLKEILDEVYQAGYDDGKNSQTIPKPLWTITNTPLPTIRQEITGTPTPATLEKTSYEPNITCEYVKAAQL